MNHNSITKRYEELRKTGVYILIIDEHVHSSHATYTDAYEAVKSMVLSGELDGDYEIKHINTWCK